MSGLGGQGLGFRHPFAPAEYQMEKGHGVWIAPISGAQGDKTLV